MKFANIICNGLAVGKENRTINLGDAFEIIAIDRIYEKMGIPSKDIIEIDLYELDRYEGEEVILPINFMFVPKIMGTNLLGISSRIIPVFLGLTITETSLTEEQCAFLKTCEPIGCREERTKSTLSENGINAYLGGCIASTLTGSAETEDKCRSKVAFIDVPKFVNPYVPEDIRNKMIFLGHEFFVSYDQVCEDSSLKKMAEERIRYYDENVSMIVTSRFHGAVIGLALGIPVILVAENNFYKFSWLSKLLPFYDRDHANEIDWHPAPVDMTEIKREMLDVAVSRIRNAYVTHCTVNSLQKRLCNPNRDDSGALRYIISALEYVNDNWDVETPVKYAIWGINENAAALYNYIQTHYPKAALTALYDGLQVREMAGLTSKVPSPENMDMESFVFVASNTASRPAEDLFKRLGKANYFLCRLEFMSI